MEYFAIHPDVFAVICARVHLSFDAYKSLALSNFSGVKRAVWSSQVYELVDTVNVKIKIRPRRRDCLTVSEQGLKTLLEGILTSLNSSVSTDAFYTQVMSDYADCILVVPASDMVQN